MGSFLCREFSFWIIGLLIVIAFVLRRLGTHLGVSPGAGRAIERGSTAETDKNRLYGNISGNREGLDLANTGGAPRPYAGHVDAPLRDLPEGWARRNEAAETWTTYDVIGHLIHCEKTDWMPRANIILQFGEARTFDPFDRFAQQRDSPREIPRPALGRVRGATSGQSRRSARNAPDDGRSQEAGTASGAWCCHFFQSCWQRGPLTT